MRQVSFMGEGEDLVNSPPPRSVSNNETILVKMTRICPRQDMSIVRELFKFGSTLSQMIILFKESRGIFLNSWTLPFL